MSALQGLGRACLCGYCSIHHMGMRVCVTCHLLSRLLPYVSPPCLLRFPLPLVGPSGRVTMQIGPCCPHLSFPSLPLPPGSLERHPHIRASSDSRPEPLSCGSHHTDSASPCSVSSLSPSETLSHVPSWAVPLIMLERSSPGRIPPGEKATSHVWFFGRRVAQRIRGSDEHLEIVAEELRAHEHVGGQLGDLGSRRGQGLTGHRRPRLRWPFVRPPSRHRFPAPRLASRVPSFPG